VTKILKLTPKGDQRQRSTLLKAFLEWLDDLNIDTDFVFLTLLLCSLLHWTDDCTATLTDSNAAWQQKRARLLYNAAPTNRTAPSIRPPSDDWEEGQEKMMMTTTTPTAMAKTPPPGPPRADTPAETDADTDTHGSKRGT
jgi:hypothetical protein